MVNLKGKVAIVTGASRGVGKGIVLGLAEAGAIVYVTGRTEKAVMLPEFLKETSIHHTVKEVNRLGGIGIAHKCDHSNDQEVEELFKQVMDEQGKLDILVNNAWGGGIHAMEDYFFSHSFWKQPISLWDDNYTVGVRSNYVASKYAAEIMVKQRSGLIVNVSFYGGRRYMNNVAYGVCKAAIDRLSADTAHELKKYNVPVFSLYPGQVSTEGMKEFARYDQSIDIDSMETPQFVGRCIAAVANDDEAIKDTGNILITAEVAQKYGFTDIDGKQPQSMRSELWF
ncbi:SDR family NAD(P)-dependent oxidoreductase [Vallitalea okinawensis]|uniref:SDR family NAD(P)-dependent oxidoreductase n=1 Tax=Vallitalea okinawensis TaxID=2078660 RepID=UPI000CFCE92D|nr:SDR family NAD(P)-dependent oxidoreductase [Vallitalea okinawensis]